MISTPIVMFHWIEQLKMNSVLVDLLQTCLFQRKYIAFVLLGIFI